MSRETQTNNLIIPLLMASVVCTATANTIIRRITLVPLKSYPYLLTQMQGLMYSIIYSSILYGRYKRNLVTMDMLRIPKRPFVWIGFWDSLGDVLGNIGTSRLPGYETPLLAKLNVIFTAIFSYRILKKVYSKSQMGAMGVVLCGSITSLLPSILGQMRTGQDGEVPEISLFYSVVYVASVAPTALAFVLKESIFQQHSCLNLDIFVVNTYGSIVSLVFTILLLPLASVPGFGGVPFRELSKYVKNGLECFKGNDPTPEDDCTGSPIAPLLYFSINVTYNICVLALVKYGGALLTFLTNTVTFPLSTILFTLPWPLLGASSLNAFVIVGLVIELSGIICYRRASLTRSSEMKAEGEELELLTEGEESGYGAT